MKSRTFKTWVLVGLVFTATTATTTYQPLPTSGGGKGGLAHVERIRPLAQHAIKNHMPTVSDETRYKIVYYCLSTVNDILASGKPNKTLTTEQIKRICALLAIVKVEIERFDKVNLAIRIHNPEQSHVTYPLKNLEKCSEYLAEKTKEANNTGLNSIPLNDSYATSMKKIINDELQLIVKNLDEIEKQPKKRLPDVPSPLPQPNVNPHIQIKNKKSWK